MFNGMNEELYLDTDDFGSDVNFYIEQYLKQKLHTCIPAVIEKFDPVKQRAIIQPCIKQKIRFDTGEKEVIKFENRPLSLDVPVQFPQGGFGSLTFPVNKGDECLLIFCERDIDLWKDFSGIQGFEADQPFDINNAVAIIGFNSTPKAIKNFSSTDVQLRNQDASQTVTLKPNNDIEIKTPTLVKIDAPETEITGNVMIAGNTHIQGTLQVDSGVFAPTYSGLNGYGGVMNVATINASSDVKINGKSVIGHDHDGKVPPF